MRLPDFEAWAIFAKVIETGSFAATAQALHLSQPTISKAISRLEASMNTTLFHRTSRKLELTESGRAVQHQAQQLLANGIHLETQLREDVNQYQGTVRFSIPISFGLQHISPILSEFCQHYPNIELDIHLADEQVDLIRERFDFALRIAQLDDSSFRAKRLCDVGLMVVGTPEYFAQHAIPQHPRDLQHHEAFIYTNTKQSHSWRFIHPLEGEFTQLMSAKIKANNSDVFLPALLAGQGITRLPEFMAHDYLKRGELVSVLNDWQIPFISLYLISPPNPLRPKRVQALMDFLSQKLKGMAWAR